ncbi:MAG: family transcriptional regulator [Cryobacterium sp.]|jgi:glucokinase|nr:family transcriptional regulator [Cryobacterium sp.]
MRDPTPSLGEGAAVVAFDVGGTDTKAALFDGSGIMLGLSRTPTPHRGEETVTAILERMQELTDEYVRAFPAVKPLAGGLVVPGLVDDTRGIAVHAANLTWKDAPFRQLASERLGIPFGFSHDVRAAGVAERRLGAARPFRDVVVVVIGTGIASSIFIDGRPHVAGGFAGEIGHSVIDPEGPPCICGARGCLEAVGSAGAIVRRYRALSGTPVHGAREVLRRAQSGDSVAEDVWSSALDAIALSVAQLAAMIAPEAIVIGGGLAQAGDALFSPLRERVDALLSFHRRPLLVPAQIGENAGLIGAALGARERSHGTQADGMRS